jgi:dolichol-phosphate mannosyltransferase
MAAQWLRFGRFNLVGLAGAGVQLLAFSLLMHLSHLRPAEAAPIAVEIAVLHNFLWHERFTWRDREPPHWRRTAGRFWRFHAANGLISVFGNAAVTYCLVEWLHVPALLSAAAAIAFCTPANFLAADRWVYAPECASRLSPSR